MTCTGLTHHCFPNCQSALAFFHETYTLLGASLAHLLARLKEWQPAVSASELPMLTTVPTYLGKFNYMRSSLQPLLSKPAHPEADTVWCL